MMERIAVVGTSCSGKTTFAEKLSARLVMTHTPLDTLYWNPDWQEKPADEFCALVDQVTSRPRWTIDGNFSGGRDLTFSRADTVN